MELENLVKLIQTVSDSDLTGFQYEENGVKLKIQKEKEHGGRYEMWQYSSRGSIAGIKGNVDLNVSYMGY